MSASFSRLSLTSLLLACAASAPRAQTPPPPVQLSPLVVQGRETDLAGIATSSSQGIVGAAELEARPFLRRGELLEVIPGVVITQHSGDGKANQYFLRGFNLDHGTDFSVSVDGMPVNLRSHAHGQGYADLNFLIPELVRQVEYSKGPFFAEVGDFSAAGAAHFRQFERLARPFVTLTLGDDRYVRAAAGATSRGATGDTTAALEYTHDDGPWVVREDSDRYNVFLRHAWTAGAGRYQLTAMGYRARWTSTDQIPLRDVAAGSLDRFGSLDPSDGGESDRTSVSFDAAWQTAAASTRLHAYALRYRLDLYSNFTYLLDDPAEGDQFNQRDRRWVFGGTLARTWSSDWAGYRSETSVGLESRLDVIDELGLHQTAQRRRLSTTRDDQVDEGSLGLHVRHETRWSEWLRTTLGLRGDGYRFKVDSDLPANSGTRLADIASPKAGVVLGPWARTEVYANVGYGFHSNDARGTTLRLDPADAATPADRVTPLARSRGAELGLRTSALPGLVSSVTLWALELDSELVFVGDAGGTEPTGRTRRRGIELANYYRATPWLALDADLAFTHARYGDDQGGGTQIANSIATVVTGGVTLGQDEGWFGSARLRYFGPQPLIEDDSVRAPSSTTVNARLGWRHREWEISLDVLNVLDRENYDIAYFYTSRLAGEPAEGIDDVHFHPAEPRTLRVSFTRRF